MFYYDNLQFRYDPFSIGLAKSVMDDALYKDLVAACGRFKPACLIRSNEMAKLPTGKMGESRWGWATSRNRSGSEDN